MNFQSTILFLFVVISMLFIPVIANAEHPSEAVPTEQLFFTGPDSISDAANYIDDTIGSWARPQIVIGALAINDLFTQPAGYEMKVAAQSEELGFYIQMAKGVTDNEEKGGVFCAGYLVGISTSLKARKGNMVEIMICGRPDSRDVAIVLFRSNIMDSVY